MQVNNVKAKQIEKVFSKLRFDRLTNNGCKWIDEYKENLEENRKIDRQRIIDACAEKGLNPNDFLRPTHILPQEQVLPHCDKQPLKATQNYLPLLLIIPFLITLLSIVLMLLYKQG